MSVRAIQEQSLDQRLSEPACNPTTLGLGQLYAEHARYVWRCLRSLGVEDRELDDAIQDLFLVVQKRLPSFDGRAATKTWLYAIAIRIARRYKERHQRSLRHAALDEEQAAPASRNTEAELDRSDRLATAREALAALDDDKREVFVLAQVEQMSATEIAIVTGLPVNTVYSRLRAARSAFAAEIKRIEARRRRTP